MVCTFAGHRQVMITGLSDRLFVEMEQLISEAETMTFLVGGHGEFDSLCAENVRRLKEKHPYRSISLCLVVRAAGELLQSVWTPYSGSSH